MQVALLTFYTNPYDDHSGPVPREMFFGREKELDFAHGHSSVDAPLTLNNTKSFGQTLSIRLKFIQILK
jgi:hypothetical protein